MTINRRSGARLLSVGSAFIVIPHLPLHVIQMGSVAYVIGFPLAAAGLYLLTVADPLEVWCGAAGFEGAGAGNTATAPLL